METKKSIIREEMELDELRHFLKRNLLIDRNSPSFFSKEWISGCTARRST
jgi:hypothetical protein